MSDAGKPPKPGPSSAGRKQFIEELMIEGTAIDEALRRAVREALLRHKKLGESIVVWRDGKVVVVPPEEIQV